jgi:hypothetical protein
MNHMRADFTSLIVHQNVQGTELELTVKNCKEKESRVVIRKNLIRAL